MSIFHRKEGLIQETWRRNQHVTAYITSRLQGTCLLPCSPGLATTSHHSPTTPTSFHRICSPETAKSVPQNGSLDRIRGAHAWHHGAKASRSVPPQARLIATKRARALVSMQSTKQHRSDVLFSEGNGRIQAKDRWLSRPRMTF